MSRTTDVLVKLHECGPGALSPEERAFCGLDPAPSRSHGTTDDVDGWLDPPDEVSRRWYGLASFLAEWEAEVRGEMPPDPGPTRDFGDDEPALHGEDYVF